MGDFYELFYEDATEISTLIGLTLTSRKTNEEDIPMAGVPAGNYEQYVSRLVRLGKSVVICDQVGTNDAGTLMERKVVQIVTPGTLTDQELLKNKESNIAMAVAYSAYRNETAYAWLDLVRGELKASVLGKENLADQIIRINPVEIIIAEDKEVPIVKDVAITHLPGWKFDEMAAPQKMCEKFKVENLSGFELDNKPLAVCALMVLLEYAEETQCMELEHLWKIGYEDNTKCLAINGVARKSLEIVEANTPNGPTLLSCIDKCITSMGSRFLMRELQNPSLDHNKHKRRAEICEDLKHTKDYLKVRKWLDKICDLERIITRIQFKKVKPYELVDLRNLLLKLQDLQDIVRYYNDPVFNYVQVITHDYSMITNKLVERILDTPNNKVSDGGVINPTYDTDLKRYHDLLGNLKNKLLEIENTERDKTKIKNLSIRFHRMFGYCFEVNRSNLNKVPDEYKRVQATKHTERFQNEQLREINIQYNEAKENSLNLEQELYDTLIDDLIIHAEFLRNLADAIAFIDFATTMCVFHKEKDWQWPSFSPEPFVDITNGRHPVVEENVAYFVPNSTMLGMETNLEVITGPNMGGKSTYMRQVALIVLLAYIGFPLPVEKATIGKINSIMTRIGANDDLAGGRSTFMVEMTEAAAILNLADEYTLVILDEIGRGTSTYDGLSLAWATAETLISKNHSLTMLATHYLELVNFAERNYRTRNVHLKVGDSKDGLVMLHRVEKGASSRSYGLQVARMAGVPNHTIDLAKKVLDEIKTNRKDGDLDMIYYADKQKTHPVIAKLRDTDLDNTSPKDALNILFELRDLDDLEG